MDTGNPKSFRPTVDQLEAREVPTVASIQLANGALVVRTDSQNSSVAIAQGPANVTIRDSSTNRLWNFSRSQVGVVWVYGGAGNDAFVSRGDAGVQVHMVGGIGNDTLDGGPTANSLLGGPGDDKIYCRAGNDLAYGGGGNDLIVGNNGNDILYGQGGNDSLNGGAGADSLTGAEGNDILITIDGTNRDVADAGTGIDTAWVDLINGVPEGVTGLDSQDFIRPVAAFANGADLTLNNDRIADPALVSTSHSYETFAGRPLFSSTGPTTNDVRQTSTTFGSGFTFNNLDDSWFLSSLSSMVQRYPNLIKTNVVDFGDGTYGVRFNGVFYRVDNDLPVTTAGNVLPAYAKVAPENSLWVAIMEKAAATASSQANPSYALLDNNSIAPQVAFTLFGGTTQTFNVPGSFATSAQLGIVLDQAVASKFAIVFSVPSSYSGFTFSAGQSYSLTGLLYATDGTVASVVLRDPIATGGTSNNGYITVSIGTLFATTGLLSFGDFNAV